MIWTALFSNSSAKAFSTRFNDLDEAKTTAGALANSIGAAVIAIIKGNCENNSYFV